MDKLLRKNCRGFSAVETVLIIVIVGMIGFVGWYVYQSMKNTNNIYSSTTKVNSGDNPQFKKINESKSTKQTISYTTYIPTMGPTSPLAKTYTDVTAKVSLEYPNSWTLKPDTSNNYCDANSCTDASIGLNSIDLTSPDKKYFVELSYIGGIGGSCSKTPLTNSYATTGCQVVTVVNSTPIAKATGLFVIEGAVQELTNTYAPFIAVQDSHGVLETKQFGAPFYQDFKLPTSAGDTIFNMESNSEVAGEGPGAVLNVTYSSLDQVKSFLRSKDANEAQEILLSLQT